MNRLMDTKKPLIGDNDSNASGLSLLERFQRLETLLSIGPTLFDGKSINCELLADVLQAVYYECYRNSNTTRNKQQQKFCEFVKPLIDKINELQLKTNDFEQLKVIGRGAFGQVALVKAKNNGNIYAMKTLNKLEMLKRAETACYREERDILLHGSRDWFTKLYFSFQDECNLYLIMDYYIGGDLLTLLSKYDDNLPEDMCRFYTSQIILALSSLHEMGYIHRDVKPDNILLDSNGHIRLADFGSCIKVSNVKTDGICTIAVGTPDYISPEILKAMEGNRNSGLLYSYEVDWWSLGVVIFESLYGETPFYAESLIETYSKIMNHKHCFKFPINAKVTDEAKDLISHLITDQNSRYKNLDQFKAHLWFTGIQWDSLQLMRPPYQPTVSGPEDTSNFDIEELRPPNNNNANNATAGLAMSATKDSLLNIHLPFVGFTSTFTAHEGRHMKINDQSIHNCSFDKSNDNSILESLPPLPETAAPDVISIPKETIDGSTDLDKSVTLENELKAARQEWSELSTLLTEMKKEKNSLSMRLRAKEEELEQQIEKNTQLRQQLRNVEKIKRQQIDDIVTLQAQLDKERELRIEAQMMIKESEDRLLLLENQSFDSNCVQISQNFAEKEELYLERISELEQQLELSQQSIAKEEPNEEHINKLEQQVLQLQQLQPNWERHVSEIIDWVSNEKEARNYLQQMTASMSKELEKLQLQHQQYVMSQRYSPPVHQFLGTNKQQSWQERRSARVDKQELLQLQLELQNEIEDKQRVQMDLQRVQREMNIVLTELNETRIELQKIQELERNKRQSLPPTAAPNILIAQQPRSPIEHQIQSQSPIIESDIESMTDTSSISDGQRFAMTSQQKHSFIVRTFVAPLKCNHCTSLMVGLVRQGLVCEVCGFACHVNCMGTGSSCPCEDARQRPVGIDPKNGIGTAYEGYVKIPKARGGVRKGWIRMFVVVCDFKLFLYDLNSNNDSLSSSSSSYNTSALNQEGNGNPLTITPFVSVNTLIDMRDEFFSVSGVLESDVIHASRKDIPCIFRVTTSMLGDDGSQRFTQLMLVDRESEKNKWIDALHELHRIIRRNKLSNRNSLRAHTILTTVQLSFLRHHNNINCCLVIDETRLLIGCDDALLCCDLDIHSYHRLTNSKRIQQLAHSPTEQLVICLAGKQRQIKLIPIRGLDNESIEWIKIPETKNATTFALVSTNTANYICVAIKKTLILFEITRKKCRYSFFREIQMPLNIQTLNTCKTSSIAVGTASNFVVYNLNQRDSPPLYLVNQECNELSYLIQNSIDALMCQPINDKEWILIFNHYGVYVDSYGRRTRASELQFPTQPLYISTLTTSAISSMLLAFSSTHIDVFDLSSIQWIQTINMKATRPLQTNGHQSLICLSGAFDLPIMIQIVASKKNECLLKVAGDPSKSFTLNANASNQRFSQLGANNNDIIKKNPRLQISGPSDFSHISHLGPGNGPFTANLIDLSHSNSSVQVLKQSREELNNTRRRDSTSSSHSSSSPFKY
ncbi:serine/threonine-protein kinase Genghis Khan-like [Oppia nitens]|uniref:serine/threonine-protein kinase Genghis Khan-like n=1 Tax=Oppia nitens TaxID=1686743 RepID=UPI0023DAE412|nr:serine/threonine-protein kinase Genghis Khan-like [Oppia nitens]